MILSKDSIAFLEHYGVKGMRWGARKDRKSGGRSSGKAKKKVRKEPWEMSEEEWKTEIKTTKKLVAGILVAAAGVKLANIVIQRQYEKMIWDSAINSMAFTILETAGKK